MPITVPIIDPKTFQFSPLFATLETINQYNKQRFELQQLDGICELRKDEHLIYGYKDITANEFWVRGHIPGHPLMPGVLMIESAAQLCSFYYLYVTQSKDFFGFAALDAIKFRGVVQPGERLVIVSKNTSLRSRLAVFETQCYLGEKLVFEGKITGSLVRT
ncbi:MAG: 3-hydroxyacyl-ACP dehydratase FabZ family protein [Planctomycetota bacterium]